MICSLIMMLKSKSKNIILSLHLDLNKWKRDHDDHLGVHNERKSQLTVE